MTRPGLYAAIPGQCLLCLRGRHQRPPEIGKLADLAVLSDNLLNAPNAELANIQVDHTLVGGEIHMREQASAAMKNSFSALPERDTL